MNSTHEFKLNCGDENFVQRNKNVFDRLCEIERSPVSELDNRNDFIKKRTTKSFSSKKSQMKFFRGKESIFKIPQDPVSKSFLKKLPDFKKNPHKWTKYSLEDVNDEDISERGNTNAALSFLKELNERNNNLNSEMSVDITEDIPKKIIFQKHIHVLKEKETKDAIQSQSTFRNSKVIMPEYVVGGKMKKDIKKRNNIKCDKTQELKLDHLFVEEEEAMD